MYHCLKASQFNRQLLDELFQLTNDIRLMNKTKEGSLFLQKLLVHKRAMLYFVQPSTRTYLSFHAACQVVGMSVIEVRDEKTSSHAKGETKEDALRTFSSYSDIIIMRHFESGFACDAANLLSKTSRPLPIVNAGSGKDEHPTQALLDIYTLYRSFEHLGTKLEDKKILFCGDLLRGRTVRSLCQLLVLFKGIKILFSAPKEFQISQDILTYLSKHSIEYEIHYQFDSILAQADAIYMTRIQKEHDCEKLKSNYICTKNFSLTKEKLALLKADCRILHPLPRVDELDSKIDDDLRADYWRQERNGMWVRAALLIKIFSLEEEVFENKNLFI